MEFPLTYNASFHEDEKSRSWIKKMPYRKLGNTGLELSLLSYGGSSLGGFYGGIETGEAIEAIQQSIKSGINYLDTSPWYGDSELIIGKAIKQIPRSAYYIGTKVGRNPTPSWEGRFNFSRAAVLKNVEESLERLDLSYVDIIQVHDVEFCQDMSLMINETIPALESVVRAGKAKFIGITGYDLDILKDIVEKSPVGIINSVLSYARFNLHDDALQEYTEFFTDRGIGVINAAPLAMGLLTNKGPPKWHPATKATKEAVKKAQEIASTFNFSLDDASLGYSLRPSNPNITTTLVSIPTTGILEQNLKIIASPISQEESHMYELIRNELASKGAGNWNGIELCQFKNWLKSQPAYVEGGKIRI